MDAMVPGATIRSTGGMVRRSITLAVVAATVLLLGACAPPTYAPPVLPTTVGVPEITPVFALKLSPAGSPLAV